MKFNELNSNQVSYSFDINKVAELRNSYSRSGIIGQPRAMSALRMGMSVYSKGYNIYISGEDGTGRHSAVKMIADELNKPVYEENHPTAKTIEASFDKARGGYLVLDAQAVIKDSKLWAEVKSHAHCHSDVKIILLGSDELYDKLCDTDEQFLKLFKVCAEFDFSMPANDENVGKTISYILETAKNNNLKEVTDGALCEILTYGCRYAEMRDELTTKLSFLTDLLFEANFFAEDKIDARAVTKAMSERDFANGITESRINREIETGEMIISLEGTKTGVVNGLAVMDRGLVSFGTPAVISVSVAPGTEGIVNIEHEAGLSGEIHDKGLLILEGYLRKQYARTFPLSIYAGICFEQSYSEVDGDSASSSELFALLSAIGDIPVRQDIAVTGSVNQLGDIQPVGGINEKITGYFDICQIMGLTGHQGVIIPKQNIKSLILPKRISKAVEEKMFHIYPISSVDEGMEILTLRPCGTRNQKGVFEIDTINRIIEDRLKKLYELSKPAS